MQRNIPIMNAPVGDIFLEPILMTGTNSMAVTVVPLSGSSMVLKLYLQVSSDGNNWNYLKQDGTAVTVIQAGITELVLTVAATFAPYGATVGAGGTFYGNKIAHAWVRPVVNVSGGAGSFSLSITTANV